MTPQEHASSTHEGTAGVADALMTLNQVADMLRVPTATLYRWNSEGSGPPYFKLGKHVRYRLSEVESWLDARKSVA